MASCNEHLATVIGRAATRVCTARLTANGAAGIALQPCFNAEEALIVLNVKHFLPPIHNLAFLAGRAGLHIVRENFFTPAAEAGIALQPLFDAESALLAIIEEHLFHTIGDVAAIAIGAWQHFIRQHLFTTASDAGVAFKCFFNPI